MEVALLHPFYWPEVRRGSERVVHDLGAGLTAAGHRARVVATHPSLRGWSLEDGVAVRRLPRRPERLARVTGLPAPAGHLPALVAHLHRRPPDVVHAFFVGEGLAALAWGRARGRPVVLSVMGLPHERSYGGRRQARAAARVARRVDAVVAISAAVADGVRAHLAGRVEVIHPGVDLDTFAPGGERAPAPTVYCPAALEDPRKQAALLLGAFARVRAERPDARLLIERPRDAALAARLAAAEGVETLAAAGDDATLVARYRRAWATVLPSRREAFGLVLAEGLACGTPGVGAREGGIPEVIGSDGVGRLHEPGDEQALARALLEGLELGGDPGVGAACAAHARRFDQRGAVRAHLALYRELGADG
ncbi:MAG TPA: glycosyltransferase family 4 protein [Solirubrobacteraceae bacterium]|nr:glycosyltransferase family 4 protein [Solirubrobacteraceae bacterium]